jgi:MFS family permease
MGMTFGAMGGPLIGGVLYEHGGYYSVYALAFALIALDIVFRVVMIERKHAVKWLDVEGEGRGRGEEVVQRGEKRAGPGRDASPKAKTPDPDIERQKELSPSSPPTPGPSGDIHDATIPEPTPHPAPKKRKGALYTLLASSRILVCLWAYFILSLLLTSFDSVLPLFVEETFHWRQTAQGLIFIPLTIPHIIDPVIGFINDRYPSSRRYIASGAFFAAVPVLVCLRFVEHNATREIVLLCALLALLGLCLASMLAILLVEVSYVVREKEEKSPEVWGKGGAMALAYGVLNSAFAGGSLVGPFLAGFIRESQGWGTMAWVLAIIVGITGVPVLLLLGGFLFGKKKGIEADGEAVGQ